MTDKELLTMTSLMKKLREPDWCLESIREIAARIQARNEANL